MKNSVSELLDTLHKEKDSFKRAKIIHHLYKGEMIPLKDIAIHLKKHPSYVSHYLRILKLPEIVIDGYYGKNVSCAHLMMLSRLDDEQEIIATYRTILGKNLSTKQTEILIRNKKYHVATTNTRIDPDNIKQIKKKLEEVFPEVKFEILQSRIRGKISIEFLADTQTTSKQIERVFNKLIREDEGETGHESLLELD